MSGASRQLSSTEGSIFFAVASASALSSRPLRAFSSVSNTGSEALDIVNGISVNPIWRGEMETDHARGPKRFQCFSRLTSMPRQTLLGPNPALLDQTSPARHFGCNLLARFLRGGRRGDIAAFGKALLHIPQQQRAPQFAVHAIDNRPRRSSRHRKP